MFFWWGPWLYNCNQKESARLYNQTWTPDGSTHSWVLSKFWIWPQPLIFSHSSFHNVLTHILWSSHKHNWYSYKIGRCDVRTQNSHLYSQNTPWAQASSSFNVLIGNQTYYSAKLLAQRKITTTQPSFHKTDIQSYLSMHLWVLLPYSMLLFHSQHQAKNKTFSSSLQPLVILPALLYFLPHQILLSSFIYLPIFVISSADLPISHQKPATFIPFSSAHQCSSTLHHHSRHLLPVQHLTHTQRETSPCTSMQE